MRGEVELCPLITKHAIKSRKFIGNPQQNCASHGEIILDPRSDEKVNSAHIFDKGPASNISYRYQEFWGRVTFQLWILLDGQKVITKLHYDRTSQVMWNDLFNKWNDKTHISTLSL